MSLHAALRGNRNARRKAGVLLLLSLAGLLALLFGAATFVADALWPTWPSAPVSVNAPALPMTVAGVLFEVPPATVRDAFQRHSGPHERIDLAFSWPSLKPPVPFAGSRSAPVGATDSAAVDASDARRDVFGSSRRILFVTIEPLGLLLPPAERLRSIYPRYLQPQTATGPSGLVVAQFRAGTPYDGEDLLYFADDPGAFYARCTRPSGVIPGTCMQEREVGEADVTLRFPRRWLHDWQAVSAGFDRLMVQLRPQPGDSQRTTEEDDVESAVVRASGAR
jgi:hypothetical protein